MVKCLDAPYAGALQRVYNHVAPLLGTRPLGAEEYTDHDINHSTRVVQRIGRILPKKGAELNQPELYILLLSVLLHDAGMWTTREEANALRSDPEFQKYCRRHWEGKLDEVERELASGGRAWLGVLGLQVLAASYNRARHADRLGTFVLRNVSTNDATGDCSHAANGVVSPASQPLRTLIGDDFVDAVVAVSVAHAWDREDVVTHDSLRPREFGDNSDLVDLRFLAFLLRLGDLLDLGEGRISALLWDYLRPLNTVAESHWRKESKLKVERCEPGLIEISGCFDIDSGGVNEREAYRLAIEWLRWLEEEIRTAHHYVRIMEPEISQRLQLGTLRFDRSRVQVKGLAVEGRVSFELDRERVLRLLGDEIYSDGCIFVRELIQNAVDATRSQMIRDHRQQIETHDPLYPPDRPWHWSPEATERYTIEVVTGRERISDKEYITFSVADPGVGMTLKQIRCYFLQVGISYYKTDEFKEEFAFPPISHFGIGFLSCLMVADRIEVITRPHNEPAGFRLSIQSPSDHFLVEKLEVNADASPGTRVTLWIDPTKPRANGWDSTPIQNIDIVRALRLPCPSGRGFDAAARQWGPFIEFPLSINGQSYGPRRLTNISLMPLQRVNGGWTTSHKSLPVRVLSRSKDHLAEGTLGFFVQTPSKIPLIPVSSYELQYKNAAGRIVGARGMYLSESGYGATLLALNFSRLPRRALTAGRQLRRNLTVVDHITTQVLRRFVADAMTQIKARSPEAAALWRLCIHIREVEHTLPLLLPCRTTEGLEWLEPSHAIGKHRRLILVPFGVAWKADWTLNVPCLGIPNSDIYRYGVRELSDAIISQCQLVAVGDICTGYLWPKDVDVSGLSLVKAKATFVKESVVVLTHRERVPTTIATRLVSPREMPAYDREGSPWEKFGLPDTFFRGQPNDVARRVIQVLGEIPPLCYANAEIEITVDETEDWE